MFALCFSDRVFDTFHEVPAAFESDRCAPHTARGSGDRFVMRRAYRLSDEEAREQADQNR